MLVLINIISAVCLCKWFFYLHFEVLGYPFLKLLLACLYWRMDVNNILLAMIILHCSYNVEYNVRWSSLAWSAISKKPGWLSLHSESNMPMFLRDLLWPFFLLCPVSQYPTTPVKFHIDCSHCVGQQTSEAHTVIWSQQRAAKLAKQREL